MLRVCFVCYHPPLSFPKPVYARTFRITTLIAICTTYYAAVCTLSAEQHNTGKRNFILTKTNHYILTNYYLCCSSYYHFRVYLSMLQYIPMYSGWLCIQHPYLPTCLSSGIRNATDQKIHHHHHTYQRNELKMLIPILTCIILLSPLMLRHEMESVFKS